MRIALRAVVFVLVLTWGASNALAFNGGGPPIPIPGSGGSLTA